MRTLTLCLAAALVVTLAPPAGAGHRPNQHCSESGDVCVSAKRVDGVRRLRIGMAAKYFAHYNLCVRGPEGGRKDCKAFEISKRDDGTYGDSVRWGRHFENEGQGAYTVTWEADGYQSPQLGFHVNH